MTKLVTRSITENQNKLPGDRKVQNFERSELLQNASVKFGHIPHQGILSHRYASIEENVFHSHIQRRPMGLLNRGDFIRSTSHNCHANVRNLNFGIQTSDTCSAKCTESKASKRYIPVCYQTAEASFAFRKCSSATKTSGEHFRNVQSQTHFAYKYSGWHTALPD